MKTLVTTLKHKFGTERIIPYAGKVKISEIGTIEVEDDLAERIVNCKCGFNYQSDDQETTTTTTEATTTTTTVTPLEKEEKSDIGGIEKEELGQGKDQDDLSNTIQTSTTTTQQVVEETTTTTTAAPFDVDAAMKELEENTLTELKELAKQFPSAEWRTLNKENLIKYLIDKMK